MAERFEIDQVVEIFEADTELIAQIGSLTSTQKEGLAELLIDNKTTIAEDTARDLAASGYLASSISGFGIPSSSNDLLQIYYTFKYSAVKLFFRQNYSKYVPEYDLFQIQKNDNPTESDKSKNQLLAEATMREFDRFSLIIDNVAYTQDINKVPQDYLNYLAQIIGYQRDDYLLLNNSTFRELLKNIIEVYKIKGSNYSFELFFNFLGFDITINEYWFDKRYGDIGIVTNQYTGSVDKKTYLFYMTPVKPTKTIPDDMNNPYLVNEDQITSPRNILMFLQYTGWETSGDTRGFTYKQLIGDTAGYTGDTFTFFKTNVMQYSLASLGSDQEPELSSDEFERIEFYAKFLSPIYVQRQISVAAAPYSDHSNEALEFSDTDRADPIYHIQKNYTRTYYVQSIDANLGDTRNVGDSTYDDRAHVIVDDPNQELYNWVHYEDYIHLTGDTANGDTNQGDYFVAGDSIGDSFVFYDTINSRTKILLKGPLSSSAKGNMGGPGQTYLIGDTYQPIRYGDTYLGMDQSTGGGYLRIGGVDTMMHLYEGKYPARYYWGDTNLGDSAFAGFGDTAAFTATPGDSFLSLGLFIGDTLIEEHNFIAGMPITFISDNNLIDRGNCESTTTPAMSGETAVDNWGATTWARDATEAYKGSSSWRLTNTGGGLHRILIVDPLSVTNLHGIIPGEEYTYEIYVKGDGTIEASEISLTYYWSLDGIAWETPPYKISPTVNNEWEKISVTFTVAAGATGFYLGFETEGTSSDTEYFNVDEISLRRTNAPYKITQTTVKSTGDTYIVIDDLVGSGDSWGSVFVDNRQFMGNYLSGHHTDTHNVVYGDSINGDTNPISAYATIKKANPTWSEEQVFININAQETGDTLFDYETTTFKVRDRDLLVLVDTVRKQYPGDSVFSYGDSYAYTTGDSRIYFGDTHDFEANTYFLVEGTRYFINQVGDSWVETSPFVGDTIWGKAYRMPNWKKYTAISTGDTTDGDSIYDFHLGFINPVYNNVINLSDTGPLTLGANFPITPEEGGRPIEIQDITDRQRRDYWQIQYALTSSDFLSSGEIVTGDSSGTSAWVLGKGGDSNFFTLWREGNFFVGEAMDGQTSGDSGTFVSTTKSTDKRGLILDIVATTGVIQVYDPGDSGDSFTSEWANLIWDDYILIHDALDNSNNGEYRVYNSTRTLPGDTTVITLGDSIINGVDQSIAGGYITNVRKSKIQTLEAGSGIVVVYDTSRKFNQLVEGDTIVVADTGDSNDGTYIVGDSIFHIRSGFGDSVGITTFNVTTALDHDDGDSNGIIKLKGENWLVGDSKHQTGFDFIEFIKMR